MEAFKTHGDLVSHIEALPVEDTFLVVAHPGSATVFLCHQLHSIGRLTVHEKRNNKTPEGAKNWVTYEKWLPDWKDFDHIFWLVREPIRTIFSMNSLFTQPRDIGAKVVNSVYPGGMPSHIERLFNIGDYLRIAAFSVLTLNLRCKALGLPLYRVEDITQRVEKSDLDIKSPLGHTHDPETPLWDRLFKRCPIYTERLLEDTVRYGYPIRDEHCKRPAPDLTSLGAF